MTSTVHTTATPTLGPVGTLVFGVKQLAERIRLGTGASQLTDRQLADIGLIRSDLDETGHLPTSIDIADHLAIRAGVRAGNW